MTLDALTHCTRCPRLVHFRQTCPKKTAYQDHTYWRKPCPGYGDLNASLLILGLAPSAHGGNRVGRIFTGDASARFLFTCLHEVGFANQPFSEGPEDGLLLQHCYITAAVKCVPPNNRPLATEIKHCAPFLAQEMQQLPNLSTILALGSVAYDAALSLLNAPKTTRFQHGLTQQIGTIQLVTSYHPSPQNTNTGKLSQSMLVTVLQTIYSNLALAPALHCTEKSRPQ